MPIVRTLSLRPQADLRPTSRTQPVCRLMVSTPVIHVIHGLLLIYPPRRDGRLSWPGWLTHSGHQMKWSLALSLLCFAKHDQTRDNTRAVRSVPHAEVTNVRFRQQQQILTPKHMQRTLCLQQLRMRTLNTVARLVYFLKLLHAAKYKYWRLS